MPHRPIEPRFALNSTPHDSQTGRRAEPPQQALRMRESQVLLVQAAASERQRCSRSGIGKALQHGISAARLTRDERNMGDAGAYLRHWIRGVQGVLEALPAWRGGQYRRCVLNDRRSFSLSPSRKPEK
ncbi:hypothetical protein D3C86_1435110 [compost metagenome]